jgi:amino acid adenylation domain-containing protein
VIEVEPLVDAIPLLHDDLHRSARRVPERVAVTCRGKTITYRELDAQSNALAHALERRGVARGDRVVVFNDNTIETAVAFYGVLKANAVVSLVNALTKADKLAYLLNDCRAVAFVTDAHLADVFRPAVRDAKHVRVVVASGDVDGSELPGFVRWEAATAEHRDAPPRRRCIDIDLAALIYTSGSTGDAKGVMLTHRNMITAATSISTYLGMREDDVVLDVLPLAFDYGLYQLIMSVKVGARVVLERSFAFPPQVLQAVVNEHVTFFPGVPTIFAAMGEMTDLSRWDLSRVRAVTNTAAALHLKHIDAVRHMFPRARIFSMYGLTECKRVSYVPPELLHLKAESVGIPIPNTEIWIVDEQGNRLPPNQVGQLVVRGATVMKGYWEKPEQTAKKLRPGPLPGEQVLWTGDLCRIDEDGFLYFVGRMDDIIKSRGEKVAPKEVEAALLSIPGVVDAAVVGVPDELLGQAVKAFVVLAEGARLTQKDLQRECQARLENFKVPKHIELVSALPKTDTGKVKKTGLK